MGERRYYVGLMSGTSADAIDAVVVELGDEPPIAVKAAHSHPLPTPLRGAVESLIAGQGGLPECAEAHVALGRAFAEAALTVIDAAHLDRSAIHAIGSHGQTIWHAPRARLPATLQIGDGAVIAEHTGITTVTDFRSRDLAAGGEGAPLAPAFHAFLFRSTHEARAVLNLGGIANITALPAQGEVIGFDTGPANTLLDGWIMRKRGLPFDADGAWAARGAVLPALLKPLLEDPYFARTPPKSTGREHFRLSWLEASLTGDEDPASVQATLAELTAQTVTNALRRFAPETAAVYVCGGGRYNQDLMGRLAHHGQEWSWAGTEALGLDPRWVEAVAFAWLARQRLKGAAGNLPSVTGARAPVVLGAVHFGASDGK